MLKRIFRWLLRSVLTLAVLAIIIAVIDFESHRVAPDSVLVVTVKGPVIERGGGGILGILSTRQTALNVVRRALDKAARDPHIVGLAIKVLDPEMELAQAQELSGAIKNFASHGKWTAAYLESAGEFAPGNLPYLVASAAEQVSMMPQGELNLVGVGMRELFARGMFDWLKIKPDFDAIGKYKTAANIFTEKDFTPAQREEDEALVDDMFTQIVGQIAEQRRLGTDGVKALINQAPLTAAAGLSDHLVDRLEYEDQFNDRVKHYGGHEHPLVDYARYARPWVLPSFSHHDRIAVIYGSGAIERGEGGFDPLLSPGGKAMGSNEIAKAFKRARDDDSVRAVVFRIDSPGGSVVGSELIRRQVELTVSKKPVVVSMSGFAASGGYWISTPASRIFADPGTITGSIGVLGGKFNISGMAGNFGVNSASVSRGTNALMFDSFTDFTPEQAQMFHNQILGDTYNYFVKLVAQGRHLPVQQVDQIAQGRVWSGEQAKQLKLVDALGGFKAALAEAKKLAKIGPQQPVELMELPTPPGLLEQLLSGGFGAQGSLDGYEARSLRQTILEARELFAGHGAFGEAYCPLVPVM
jgi:protease IV